MCVDFVRKVLGMKRSSSDGSLEGGEEDVGR